MFKTDVAHRDWGIREKSSSEMLVKNRNQKYRILFIAIYISVYNLNLTGPL